MLSFNTLDGGTLSDTLTGNWLYPTSIFGGTGDDSIVGGSEADSILGENGADIIQARGGNDTLIGNNGSDSILGEGGDDSLSYSDGDGQDVYASGGDGLDRIRQQNPGSIYQVTHEIHDTTPVSNTWIGAGVGVTTVEYVERFLNDGTVDAYSIDSFISQPNAVISEYPNAYFEANVPNYDSGANSFNTRVQLEDQEHFFTSNTAAFSLISHTGYNHFTLDWGVPNGGNTQYTIGEEWAGEPFPTSNLTLTQGDTTTYTIDVVVDSRWDGTITRSQSSANTRTLSYEGIAPMEFDLTMDTLSFDFTPVQYEHDAEGDLTLYLHYPTSGQSLLRSLSGKTYTFNHPSTELSITTHGCVTVIGDLSLYSTPVSIEQNKCCCNTILPVPFCTPQHIECDRPTGYTIPSETPSLHFYYHK